LHTDISWPPKALHVMAYRYIRRNKNGHISKKIRKELLIPWKQNILQQNDFFIIKTIRTCHYNFIFLSSVIPLLTFTQL
jgi:hypothetical protein